eukprot:TRINITY_DN2913_c0_g1_i10.p1 TRINITY_DN2913_c0_g1~~TRINITY_DN2913_c0_g1_i10.p1  ORF type:complete len:329 (+),score=37.35 TRINITY_DN2913_c0_g1_i10:1052-2038(+)
MDYVGLTEDELSFKRGDIIRFACVDVSGWAFGCTLEPSEGWFPVSYVEYIDEKTGESIQRPMIAKNETRSVLEQRKFTRLTLNHHLSKRLTLRLQASLQSTGLHSNKKVARKPSKIKKLEHHLKADSGLPLVFDEAIKYLKSTAGDVEGIFKISAPSEEVESLRKLFACDACASLNEIKTNAYAVADSIKNFLYYLYEPIFTVTLLPSLLVASQKLQKKTYEDPEQLEELKELVSQLPVLNYSIIYNLLDLIAYVCHNSATRVELKDVISTIAPFITRPPKSDKSKGYQSDSQQPHRQQVEQINHLLWVLAFNRDFLFSKMLNTETAV